MYLERYAHAFNPPVPSSAEILKKHLVKILTFWIFPSVLRHQTKRRLRHLLGMGPAPETLWEKHVFEKRRQQFLAAQHEKNIYGYKIVSLGCDCFSRTIPTLWGIKPRKKQGEKGCPFDLSDNPLPAVVKYLENDFKGYFNSLAYNKQLKSWWLADDEIVYCHEDDCTETSRSIVTERFASRINNLRQILYQDTKPALFISHFNPMLAPADINETEQLYNRMYKTLQTARGKRGFRLMIVDTSGKLSAATNLLPEIKLLSCPWLPQPYVWHQPECRYKKTGLKFEQLFIGEVIKILAEMQ